MTDELIERAKEAGGRESSNPELYGCIIMSRDDLECFFEQAFIDGMQEQMRRSVDRAVNERIGTSDSDKGEYAIHQVRIFRERLADAIEAMPFGDTASSFATFVREFK